MYDSIDCAMDVTEKMIFWFTDVQFNLASKLHSWHLGCCLFTIQLLSC